MILALWYFVFYNFRAGHVNNIRLGSDKARVERVLGEADAEEDFIWEYYGKNYLRLNQKIEDKTVELFNAVGMEEIETLTEELAALAEELFNLEYKYICVTFDGEDRVCEVVYDAARCDGALLSPKWKQPQDDDSFFSKLWAALKSGIGAGERIEIAELPAFYDLSQSRLSAQVYYADGSYRCTYLSAETLAGLNTYEAGEHTLSWQDGWGNYTATGYEDAVMTGKARSALEGIYCLADEAPKGSRMVILPDGSRQMIAADWPEDIRNGRKTWKSGTAAAVYWGGEWDYVNGVPTAK